MPVTVSRCISVQRKECSIAADEDKTALLRMRSSLGNISEKKQTNDSERNTRKSKLWLTKKAEESRVFPP